MRNKHDPPTKLWKVMFDMRISCDHFVIMCYKESLQVISYEELTRLSKVIHVCKTRGRYHVEDLS